MKTTIAKKIAPQLSLLGYFSLIAVLFFFSTETFATAAKSLGDVAESVRSTMQNVAALITAVAYVGGIGFAMMGLLKLKAHKDNPTQVPLSQPITLLCIAAGLVFLPALIKTAGQTIWGQQDAVGTSGSKGTQEDAGLFKGS